MKADLHDAMRASEFASLAAFARAVLARAHSDNPQVTTLRLDASVIAGEVEVAGLFLGADDAELAGFVV
jgi:hypothetical protein